VKPPNRVSGGRSGELQRLMKKEARLDRVSVSAPGDQCSRDPIEPTLDEGFYSLRAVTRCRRQPTMGRVQRSFPAVITRRIRLNCVVIRGRRMSLGVEPWIEPFRSDPRYAGLLREIGLFGGCYARRSSLDFAEARRRVKAPLATLAADAALTRQRAPVRIGNYWSDGLMCPDQAVRSTGRPAPTSLRTSRRSEHVPSAGKGTLAVLRRVAPAIQIPAGPRA
jgi:hypothetical protein